MIRSKILMIRKKVVKLLKTREDWSQNLKGITEAKVTNKFQASSTMNRQAFAGSVMSVTVVHLISRLLGFPLGKAFRSNQRSNTFIKFLLPQILKGNTWPRSAHNSPVPKFSRGFKGNQGAESSEGKKPIGRQSPKRERHRRKESDEFKSPSAEFISERTFNSKLNDLEKLPGLKRAGNDGDIELPPPRKCRLSCPLPPPGFTPPDTKEFFPSCQAASVKFQYLPKELVAQSQNDGNLEHHELNRNLSASPQPYEAESHTEKTSKPESHPGLPFYQQEISTPQMKALLFDPNTGTLRYSDVEAPSQIHKDQVLVQVTYSGVSRTDLFVTEGMISCGNQPVVLGHEISGKVYAVGRDVNHVETGDNVTVNPYTACSVCRYCARGHFSCCVNEGKKHSLGTSKNGGWAEYVLVNKSQVYKIPSQMGLDQAALIQPLSCVLCAMSKLNISPEMDILIHGLGLAGCLWASVLHRRGHQKVFVSDKHDRKRKQFQRMNLEYSFIPSEDIGKFSADIVIECTGCAGHGASTERIINILNPKGQMCFFGKPKPVTEIRFIPYDIITKEITIVGSSENAFCFSEAISLASTLGYRYLDFEKLGIRVFDPEHFQEAFRLKKADDLAKIMFKFDS